MKKTRFLHTTIFLFVIIAIILQATSWAAVIRVKPDGNDANSGSAWATAKKTVQAAITSANQGDEIWVAAGSYTEHIKNKTTGPSGSEVAVDMALYGGFAGTETSRDQRNWQTNLTTLDGGGAPSPTVSGSVIIIDSSATQATRIDGFVITGGHGIAAGGILISGSGPIIANNRITGNITNVGGGILISNYKITEPQVHPIVTGNIIVYNYAVEVGGGIVVVGSERLVTYDPVSPTITGNNISRNISEFHAGGIGIFGHAAPRVTNNLILGNTAAYAEENYLGNGGGIYATSRDVDNAPLQFTVCAPVIVGNVVAANGANFGGGIHLWDTDVDHGGIPVVTNNTVVGNNGTGISWITTSPVIQSNLVAFNSSGLEQGNVQSLPTALRNNCVYGNALWGENTGYNGLSDQTGINGNISTDPQMANYRIGNFHLQTGSPCVDAGYSAAIQNGWTDIDGQARIIGNGVDIGADESDGTIAGVPTPIYHVKPTGNDAQNGLSWATAKKTVAAAIGLAQNTGGDIWVAAGTYVERNILPAFIYLYGGFAGTETLRTSRDVTANPTILDGGGGTPTVVNSLFAGYFLSAIDGFTIQNGGLYTGGSVPSGSQGYKGRGGGIYCQVTSPLIQNNIIRRNSLGNPFDSANKTGYGGGIYTYLSYALIQENTITENEVINSISGQGGGIFVFRSMPTILRNTITNNRAKSGAAIYGLNANPRIIGNNIENNSFYTGMPGYYMGASDGAVTLDMCWDFLIGGNRIKGNIAAATGAAGAGINVKTNLAGQIRNNVIAGNSVNGMGGGIYALAPLNATSSLYIVNNTIVGNTASSYGVEWGGGVALSIPPPITTPPDPIPDRIVMANNIIAFNNSGVFELVTTPMVYPTLIKNNVFNTSNDYLYLSAGATDIQVDPGFVNRAGGNLHLLRTSPCVDGGDNNSPTGVLDYEGKNRIVDGNGDGVAVVDMGALELAKKPYDVVDFDGDGKTDYAVWRPGDGTWYIFRSSDGAITQRQWGTGTIFATPDVPVPGDYDGDGVTDIAVWRPSDGMWYAVNSRTGTATVRQWGSGSVQDIPVPGDYDGDGKTDYAVWRPGNGTWYVVRSSDGGVMGVQWGTGTAFPVPDVPVPGDYDGDGVTDIAVWRPSDGTWYVVRSSDGVITQRQWGTGTIFATPDVPVPGDYDGDGVTDIAVWRPGDGMWYAVRSSDGGVMGVQWGTGTAFPVPDVPVPGDYDGDGKTDMAVWRPGDGDWYIIRSFDGALAQRQWGAGWTNDCPVSSNMATR